MALSPVELCLGSAPGDEGGLVVEALGSDGAVLATGTWTASSGAPLGGVLDEFLGALDAVAHTVRVVPAPGLVAVDGAGATVHPVLVGPATIRRRAPSRPCRRRRRTRSTRRRERTRP